VSTAKYLTIRVRVCDVCGDHWQQERTPGNGWHEWRADGFQLYKCDGCGMTVCHSCHDDRWCCNPDETVRSVEKQRTLFMEVKP
jgi:hypothetical protein